MNYHDAIMSVTSTGEQFTAGQLIDRLGLEPRDIGHIDKALKTAVRYGLVVKIKPRGPHYGATWRRLE